MGCGWGYERGGGGIEEVWGEHCFWDLDFEGGVVGLG